MVAINMPETAIVGYMRHQIVILIVDTTISELRVLCWLTVSILMQ